MKFTQRPIPTVHGPPTKFIVDTPAGQHCGQDVEECRSLVVPTVKNRHGHLNDGLFRSGFSSDRDYSPDDNVGHFCGYGVLKLP